MIYKNGASIKYDFIVRPGGNPNQIKLKITYADNIELDEDGRLVLTTSMGTITENKPISFQEGLEVKTQFELSENILTFKIEDHNKEVELVIDPVLAWATYYGGSDYNYGNSCSVDDSGYVYLAGDARSTMNIASGGYQNTIGGSYNAYLVKFNSAGVRLWATYYGGIAGGGSSCALDNSGNVYLAGSTRSVANISYNGHQNIFGGTGLAVVYNDAYLVKFNSAGVRLWGTYYGGVSSDFGVSCTVDDSDNVYLSGQSTSYNNIAFGGHQNVEGSLNPNSKDAFLVKFNSAGSRMWGTYYGGYNDDTGMSCAVDDSGNVYLAGPTNSYSSISYSGHQNAQGGNSATTNAFLVKFSSSGTRLWGTYYSGYFGSWGYSCAVDDSCNVYLSGYTGSTTNIAFNGHQNVKSSSSDAFLVKFNSSGIRLWGTYYGGPGYDLAHSCSVDDSGNVYLAGRTSSTTNIALRGFQNDFGGIFDAFLVKFRADGTRLWGTYYGGLLDESFSSCTVGDSGNVYFLGSTKSTTNIALGGHQDSIGGNSSAFLAKILCEDSVIVSYVACNSFTWINGVTYTASNNTAFVTLANSMGCDSVVVLNLIIGYPDAVTDTVIECGSSFVWMDSVTYTSNNYTAKDTLTNVYGCDSVVTLSLTFGQATSGIDTVHACYSYQWLDGVTYTSNNTTATHTIANGNLAGCDSLVTLNLTVSTYSYSVANMTACDSLNWINGVTYYSSVSGIYDTLVGAAASGCDSIVILNFIKTLDQSVATVFACGSYTWINGVTYTSNNNTAVDTLTNSLGCDSVVTLNLTINNTSVGIDTQIACVSYTWIDGVTYTSSTTTAMDTLLNANNCDSIITLNLTILNPTTGIDTQVACDSYTWINGVTYVVSNNTAKDTLINSLGCDSIVTLNLTINNSNTGIDTQIGCKNYTWIDGITYTASNNTATYTLTNSFGCDSIITLNLTFNNLDTSVNVNSHTLTANQSGASYQWLDCSTGYTIIPNETNFSFTAMISGSYAVEITMNSCTDTSSCITLTDLGITESDFGSNFKIYPNPTQGKVSIGLGKTYQNVNVQVLNSVGQVVATPVKTKSTDYIEFEITGERAVYFIRIETRGKSGLWKIVKD